MKRVKIMLTAVTALVIVGGALAFKAKTFSTVCAYTTAVADAGKCAFSFANSTTTTTDPGPNPPTTSYFATTRAKVDGNCPAISSVSGCNSQFWTKGE